MSQLFFFKTRLDSISLLTSKIIYSIVLLSDFQLRLIQQSSAKSPIRSFLKTFLSFGPCTLK